MSESYCYVAIAGDLHEVFIDIGVTTDPKSELSKVESKCEHPHQIGDTGRKSGLWYQLMGSEAEAEKHLKKMHKLSRKEKIGMVLDFNKKSRKNNPVN